MAVLGLALIVAALVLLLAEAHPSTGEAIASRSRDEWPRDGRRTRLISGSR
jgi:hypothetical protein